MNNFTTNRPNKNFSVEELTLLNKGMNWGLKENKLPMKDIIMDIGANIQYRATDEGETIRKGLAKIILDNTKYNNTKRNKDVTIAKDLNEKPVLK